MRFAGTLLRLAIKGFLAFVVYDIAIALFERFAPRPWVTAWRRWVGPRSIPVLGWMPGWAVIETTGRKSGDPRLHPVGGRLRGHTFWFVSADGRASQYIKNIEANPRVRVKVHGRWHDGVATVMPDDDVGSRLLSMNPLNSMFIWICGEDLLPVRVDLAS